MNTCPKCGLPIELCMCSAIARESQAIEVYTDKRRFGKFVTIVEGIGKDQIKKVASELKSKLACGGTIRENLIELQGDHKKRIGGVLVKLGFDAGKIKVK